METIFLNDNHTTVNPCAVTIGFFDGVHKGHLFLIEKVKKYAQEKAIAAGVVTFDRHPREVLTDGYQPEMLSTLDERLERLAMTGIDYCFVVPFNQETAALTAHEFMENVLHNQFHVQQLVIGYDHRFGHNRSEKFDDYVRYGEEMGMEVVGCDAFVMNQIHISSSAIRRYLSQGNIEQAEQCLGYPYTLSGQVVRGEQKGRKMGFPTANLDIEGQRKLIPQQGAYAVRVKIEGEDSERLGMMNIGHRPTFGNKPTTIEVHILDFDGNLYGQRLTISFMHYLRNEHQYDSPEHLAEQLRKDCEEVRKLMNRELD